jgi:hypothetical protein
VTSAGASALLEELVDYAGLFPPAGRGMAEAVAEFTRHREGPQAWMLGRFVVPAARLDELEEAAGGLLDPTSQPPWSISALVGPAFEAHADAVVSFNSRHAGGGHIDSVELRASSRVELDAALDTVPSGVAPFVELPLDGGFDELLGRVRQRGANAKVRTGGLEAEAIPGPGPLARFIEACRVSQVPFKATAGLHHPVRAEHPLTYDDDAPRSTMHGFLNVFTAAALARGGMAAAGLEVVLRESDPGAFRLDDEGLVWRDHRVPTREVALMRRDLARSFGSCSFREPVDDLKALGVIP